MVKVSLFNSTNDVFINHKNINTITIQDDNRLLVKMQNGDVCILNMNITTFLERVKEYDSALLKFNNKWGEQSWKK